MTIHSFRCCFVRLVTIGLINSLLVASVLATTPRNITDLSGNHVHFDSLGEDVADDSGTFGDSSPIDTAGYWSQIPMSSESGTITEPKSAPPSNPPSAPLLPPPKSKPKADPPKYPSIDVTGFFQLDAAWFNQDAASRLIDGDIPDLIDFRRARLAAKGKVAENFAYMIEFDFAFPGRPNFMDVWVEAQQLPFGNLRIGQFRQAFGMDGPTSVKDLTFLERALPFVFVPFRQTGLMAYGTEFDDAVTWAVSGYRFPADPFGGTFGDKGYGLSTRVTTALFNVPDENLVAHIGGSYSYNRPSTGLVRYATTPEVGFNFGVAGTVPFFVDTGALTTDSVSLYGIEAAFSLQGLLIQAEAVAAEIDPSFASGSAWLKGAYAQISYVLTGEVRPYNAKQGVYGRVKPNCDFGAHGGGAWEVAARYSYLDFNDAPVMGGRLSDVTAGLNWYLNSFTKLQFNYIHAFLNRAPVGDASADVFALRCQLDF
ncbi:MAG: porin [Planctomycetaceae bacterium]|nr:porin [Planctomycetaceae bacterium]